MPLLMNTFLSNFVSLTWFGYALIVWLWTSTNQLQSLSTDAQKIILDNILSPQPSSQLNIDHYILCNPLALGYSVLQLPKTTW